MGARPVLVPSSGPEGEVREVTAWPTGVPGLVVAQVPADAEKCPGLWSVVHARSGKRVPYCLPDPEAALGLALALRDAADWQQPGTAMRAAMKTPAYRAAVWRFRPLKCAHGLSADTMLDNGVIA